MGFASRTPFITTLNTLQAGITPVCKDMCCSHFPKAHPETLPLALYKHTHYSPLFSCWVVKQHLQNSGVLSTWVARVRMYLTGYWLSPVTTFLPKNQNIRVATITIWKLPSSSFPRLSERDGMNHSSSSNSELIDFPKGRVGIVNRHLGDAFQQILCSRECQLLSTWKRVIHTFWTQVLKRGAKIIYLFTNSAEPLAWDSKFHRGGEGRYVGQGG